MTLNRVTECDSELKRIAEQERAIKEIKGFWKLPRLQRRRAEAIRRRIELQHGDLFRALGQELCLADADAPNYEGDNER